MTTDIVKKPAADAVGSVLADELIDSLIAPLAPKLQVRFWRRLRLCLPHCQSSVNVRNDPSFHGGSAHDHDYYHSFTRLR